MIWVLYGLDEYRRTLRRQALVTEQLQGLPADFALQTYRSREVGETTLLEWYDVPFGVPYKVVVLLLEGTDSDKKAAKLLAQYFQRPAAHVRLIIDLPTERLPDWPWPEGAFREAYAPMRLHEVEDWLLDRAQYLGLSLQPEAAASMVEALGTDLRQLDQMLETLRVYWLSAPSPTPLSAEEVGEALGLHPQYSVFRLLDALAEGNRSEVLRLMAFFAQAPKSYPLAEIIGRLRTFYQNLAVLLLTRTPPRSEAIRQRLQLRFAFQTKPYEMALTRYTLHACNKALSLLRQVEARQKGLIPSKQPEEQLLLSLAQALVGLEAPNLQ
ncbi:MAG: hypothetical protein NZ958_04400 [Bacteroidia bacterium]|nr:hypothetical protein [Bacteroidia bacterium]MDW8088460.1 hypothetical protein [Bacteroidia bacterium]